MPSDFAAKHASLTGRWLGSCLGILGRSVLIQITTIASAVPLLVLISFYLFVCLARIDLGHWPVFNDPYPRALPSGVQRVGLSVGLMFFPVANIAGVFLALGGRRCYADFPLGRLLAFNVASAGLLLGFVLLDPGRFWNWFVD